MKNYPKKTFFEEPSKSNILKVTTISANSDLVDRIENLQENEALIIETGLIPLKYETPRKFLKHGLEVKPTRVYTLEELAKERFVPVALREQAFNNIKQKTYCSYSFMPFVGKDKRKRKVSLAECLEASRLFAYSHTLGTGIEIKIYEDAQRVKKEGATVACKVTSRRIKQPKYTFNLVSVPVIDSEDKFAIAQNILSTGHNCKKKQYDFRYRYEDDKESSTVFNFCAHEITAYWEIINHYWNVLKRITPLEMSQFAIPTQFTVDFYKRLCDSVLIKDENINEKDRLRKLNKAEKEILLWGLVYKYKHDKTFFAREKIERYNWSLRNI